MEQEALIEVIDKLTDAHVTLAELAQIQPLIGTEDFTETFEIVAAMPITLQPIGRATLATALDKAAKGYHEDVKTEKLRTINRWLMPAIAASVLVVCATSIVHVITDYNNPKNYRKVYLETDK
jgi:archaellum biogenesis protein FlaJ (TadC family)